MGRVDNNTVVFGFLGVYEKEYKLYISQNIVQSYFCCQIGLQQHNESHFDKFIDLQLYIWKKNWHCVAHKK